MTFFQFFAQITERGVLMDGLHSTSSAICLSQNQMGDGKSFRKSAIKKMVFLRCRKQTEKYNFYKIKLCR